MRSVRWLRSPEGRPTRTILLWSITVMNVVLFAHWVRERFDAIAEAQSLRLGCEVNGGYYGAVGNGATRCLTPKRARASEGETR